FLADRPLTEAQLEVARLRFDRPTLFGRRCARSIATRLERGQELARGGDTEGAMRCLGDVVRDDPNSVPTRLRVARILASIGQLDGAGRAARQQAEELVADVEWTRGEHGAALERYERLMAASGTETDLARLVAKRDALAEIEDRPLTARAVQRALVLSGPA